MIAACALALVGSACGSTRHASAPPASISTAAGSLPSPSSAVKTRLTVGYFASAVAEPETVIGSVRPLEARTGAKIKWVPISSGVAALAAMRAGAFDFVAGVGSPPTVAAIANGTPIDVVWVQGFDGTDLLVPGSITSPQGLAGKTIGDLEGSSEDYELRGWLAAEGLTGKVHVFGFASEPADAAAYLGGRISAAYVSGVLAAELESKGAHSLTDAKMIASLGYSSVDVLLVTHADVVRYPRTVQNYICAEMDATEDMFGPSGKTYFADSAPLIGVPVSLAVAASVDYLPFYLPPDQELYWLNGGAASPLVSSYLKVGGFDQAQGRITSAPSAATLAAHIDPSFAQYALAGKC